MRVHVLNRKILAGVLQATKASMNLELAKTPLMITYENELNAFRNQFNQKFPHEFSSSNNRRTALINETYTRSSGRCVIF